MDKFTIITVVGAVVLVLLVVFGVRFRLKPRKIKQQDFQDKWKEIKNLLGNKETWGEAILDADQLLDRAGSW